ncbi:reverse transcriptase domain-containing protein [Mesorhizobium sp.]|uniref:reverse transcriptase domain-containing protein n=1 Tax=Mesorhizobium sp. TaxID=1871066 RepID=UPI00344BCEF7
MEKNGEVVGRTCGTPQGGVVSPILSNLFMHYAFDLWMTRTHPDLPWCRYADDGLVHCRSEQQAEALKAELGARLAACGLQMHPTKTKIVYRKDQRRRGKYPNVVFDFLGYKFRPRRVAKTQRDEFFCGYTPAASPTALKSMRATIKSLNCRSLHLIGQSASENGRFCLSDRMIHVLDRQIELVLVMLGIAAIFGAAVGQHPA